MKKLRCMDCKFFSGVQCHGHGECWGDCRFIDDLERFLDLAPDDPFRFICFDDTICHFITFFGFVPSSVKYLDETFED